MIHDALVRICNKSKDLPIPAWLQRGSLILIRATVSRLQLGETIRRLHARRGRGCCGLSGYFPTAEAAEFLKRHETSRQQQEVVHTVPRLRYFADRWDVADGGSWRRTY
jgi:hypothetical protein